MKRMMSQKSRLAGGVYFGNHAKGPLFNLIMRNVLSDHAYERKRPLKRHLKVIDDEPPHEHRMSNGAQRISNFEIFLSFDIYCFLFDIRYSALSVNRLKTSEPLRKHNLLSFQISKGGFRCCLLRRIPLPSFPMTDSLCLTHSTHLKIYTNLKTFQFIRVLLINEVGS